jgi:hypothetical protein
VAQWCENIGKSEDPGFTPQHGQPLKKVCFGNPHGMQGYSGFIPFNAVDLNL